MKTLVLINPSSAGGKALEARGKIESALNQHNIDYKIHISKNLEDMINTVKSNLSSGFENFIAAGGDGTIHYIANILVGSNKKMGTIPLGSGNDAAANLGIPTDIEDCCKIIKNGKTKSIDMGLINDKYYYLCIAGSGFDSKVNDLANNTRLPLKGGSKYKYSVYKTLLTFRSKEFTFLYDGQKRKMQGMFVVASNMSSYGSGMKITPDADPCDGLFDVCIIKRMSKPHFIKVFPKVFEGKHTEDPSVEIFRTSELTLSSEYDFSIFADGEYICKLPAKFKIAPRILDFLVP